MGQTPWKSSFLSMLSEVKACCCFACRRGNAVSPLNALSKPLLEVKAASETRRDAVEQKMKLTEAGFGSPLSPPLPQSKELLLSPPSSALAPSLATLSMNDVISCVDLC